MKKVLYATIFAIIVMTGVLLVQKIVSYQGGISVTMQNAVLIPMDETLPDGKPGSTVLIFDNVQRDGCYKAYISQKTILSINGEDAKLLDLWSVYGTSTAKIRIHSAKSNCSMWMGIGTYTSIEVITQK